MLSVLSVVKKNSLYLILKNFLIYSAGSFLLRVISLIIVPLVLRKLTPADYGTLALITSFIAIAGAIIGLGLRQLLSLEYFHCTSHEEKQRLINDVSSVYTGAALICIGILWYLRAAIISSLFFNTISTLIYACILAHIFLLFFVELLYQILQYQQHATLLIKIQMSIAMLSSGLTYLFVWYYNIGFTGVVLAQFLGMCLGAFYAVSYYIKNTYCDHLDLMQSIKKSAHYIRSGIPFISSILLSWIMSSSDRWILGYYTSLEYVGIYSIADLFAQVFNAVILQSWAGSYLPYIMQHYAQNKDNLTEVEKYNQHIMRNSLLWGAVCISVGYAAGIPLLRIILPKSYHASLQYILILLFGQLFLLGSYFCSSFIQFQKKRWFVAYSYAIPAFLNITGNILLIPSYTIYGAAVATTTSYFIYFMLTLVYNKKLVTTLRKKGTECPS